MTYIKILKKGYRLIYKFILIQNFQFDLLSVVMIHYQ